MKKTTLIEKIQTGLLGLCFTGISFCLNVLWEINTKLAKNDVVDERQDVSIAALTLMSSTGQKERENNSNRITYLEAILPDVIKKIKK